MSGFNDPRYSTSTNQKYAYVRIGIYSPHAVGKQIHQVNQFDLHFSKVLLYNSIMEGYYSGATKSIADVGRNAGRRTAKDEEMLLSTGEVQERFRLSNGGEAALLFNRTKESHECWLFGPLWMASHQLGSLVVRIHGLKMPVMKTRHPGPSEDFVSWMEFPKAFASGRGVCTLWGSYYTGIHNRGDMDQLLKQRQHVFPIFANELHTWRIEAHAGALGNITEVRKQKDTSKHRFRSAEL